MDKSALYRQSYKRIEREIIDLSDIIYITDKEYGKKGKSGITPLRTYSNYISDLLVRCSIEVESLMKFLYGNIRSQLSPSEQSKWPDASSTTDYFDQSFFNLVNERYKLDSKAVYIYNPTFDLKDNRFIPFSHHNFQSGAGWKEAYNCVKHNRYEKLEQGNIKNLLYAASALYLLNIYSSNICFDIDKNATQPEIYDFGSEMFAVKGPEVSEDALTLYVQNVTMPDKECPLVASYTNSNYEMIKYYKRRFSKQLKDYINKCPELKNDDFLSKNKDKIHPFKITLMDIANYRKEELKAIKNYNEKKEKLIASEEWCYLKNTEHMIDDDTFLTKTNIDKTIDDVETTFARSKTYSLYNEPLKNAVDKIPITVGLVGSSFLDAGNFYGSKKKRVTLTWYDEMMEGDK